MTPDEDGPAPSGRTRGPVDPRLLRYARASRGFLAATAANVLAQTGVVVAFAWLLSSALVGVIGGAPVSQVIPLLGWAAGLVVIRALLTVASEHVSARGAARASLQLRDALVRAVARLGPGWLGSRNSASLAVTAGHGLQALDSYFGRYLPQLVATGITLPILIAVIALADPISGVTVVVTIPLIPLFMVLIGLATRAAQRRQFRTLGRLAARFADTVNGLGTLKIYGRQHRAADGIEQVTREYKRETMSVLRVSFLSGFALEFLASISVAIIAVTIGFRLLAGEMDLLIGLFVLLLAPEAYLPLRQVGVQFHAAAEGVAATDEIFGVLDAAASLPMVTPAQGPEPQAGAPRRWNSVEVRGLRVRRGERMLPPADLRIEPGRVVLVEGASGSGKSSLVAALLGFAEHQGEIAVDGTPVAHARGELAWAGQHPGLIAGTVAGNVALGDPNPDEPLVRACLADAQATEIDPALELGVHGAGLSGGQAQRVAVARALYRLRSGRAGALVLDEPSSALDPDLEAALWRRLRTLADEETPTGAPAGSGTSTRAGTGTQTGTGTSGGPGILLLSHRRSARAIADTIITLPAPVPADSRGTGNAEHEEVRS